jgi:hypothetical protein
MFSKAARASTIRPGAYSPLMDRHLTENRAEARLQARRDRRETLRRRLAYAVGPTILLAMGATVVASAQSSSPFANKKKVNAWELPQAGTTAPAATPTSAPARPATASSGLRLRTRSLDGNTAAAPPPGQVAPVQPAPTRSVPPVAASPAAPAASVTSQAAAPALSSPPLSSPPLSSPPLSSPPLGASAPTETRTVYTSGSNAVPTDGYVYQSPSRSAVQPQSEYQAQYQAQSQTRSVPSGSYGAAPSAPRYGSPPRASVNNPPSNEIYARNSIDNEADLTVHELQRRGPAPTPWGAPPQAYAGGDWGAAASNNPTAGDFGYSAQTYGQAQTSPQNQPQGSPYPSGGASAPPDYANPNTAYPSAPPARRGFMSRVGLNALSTLIRGAVRAGVAGRDRNGWEEAFIGDADLEVEISSVTQGGLEWGVHGQVRAQYDEGRKGFTRRLPDCPPTTFGCPTFTVPGSIVPASVRGHTSQFYTFGPDVAKDEQIALESAHVFLRSAYGDVTVGRDDGAAFLFSLGAPTLLNVGASNSPVDYTGLDAVKTLNDASGFAEKITYTSPRLLGDQVGVGVQVGVSYAPDARGCGVDYCVDLNDIPNVVAPDVQDIVEAGIALDRTFGPGVGVEATATYARGTESSGLVGLRDLEAIGAGLEFTLNSWTLGGSWLKSNQAVVNGDYESYDVGLTWQPSKLGFTVGYGQAVDDLVGLKSDQIVGGVSYDINDRIRISTGVQHADRKTIRDVGGLATLDNEKSTSIFIEGGFTF